MRLRSATKRIAAIAAERLPQTVGLPVDQKSRLLDLPAELRCLILCFAIAPEDEPPVLVGDIYRHSTAIIDPPVTFVCRQLRAEALPLYYSRKAFFFNLSKNQQSHKKLQKWAASVKTTPSKIQRMRKVMFFGRAMIGQVGVTIDFAKMKIIDARWWCYQNSLTQRCPSPVHHHMGVRHCSKLQAALDAALQGDETPEWPRAYQAMLNIVEACHDYFWTPTNNRAICCARKPHRLGEKSSGPCGCLQVVDLIV
jgi:hypothetical protein